MIFEVTEEGLPPQKRYVVQHHVSGAVKRVSHISPHVDPMTYPMLYWGCAHKNFGWRPKMEHATGAHESEGESGGD